ISIHIPFCNEPPEMVIATIQSCIKQQYPDFEIIVLSNNTTKTKLWKPVENFCKRYPNIIRFEHHEEMEGFKGGALDRCRALTGKKMRYLFTVDADYILDPYALRRAVRHLKYTDAHLLQFPQSYIEGAQNNDALNSELYSYFELYSRVGNLAHNALPTGTLSLIELDALDRAGGWVCASITEDAQLGVKFWKLDMKTYFIPEVLGEGILPNTVPDLVKQRSRWIFGNAQVIKSGIFKKGETFFSSIAIFLQLSAWSNLLAIPLIYLIFQAFLWALMLTVPSLPFYLAMGCVAVHLLSQFILLGIASGFSLKSWLGSFMIRTALLESGAFQWIPAIFGVKRPFQCTNKFARKRHSFQMPILLPGLFFTLFLISWFREFAFGYLMLLPFVFFTSVSFTLYLQFREPKKVLKTQLN
ncbi:MAG: glycosyltransferase family 2 protein, partial [Leeuwenhoekiella sp.]